VAHRPFNGTADGCVTAAACEGVGTSVTRVTVGAGIRLGDLYDTLWDQHGGLMVSAGTCRHVGAGGHGQGGGFGYISRTYGLFSDRIVQYEIVLADGQLVNATAVSHPNLYWALRGGGGGNFGVVTSFVVDPIIHIPNVVRFNGTSIMFAGAAAELLFALQEVVPHMDPRLNMAVAFAIDVGVQIDGHFVNGSEAELKALLSSCEALAKFRFKFYNGKYKELMNDGGPNQAPHGFIAASKWIYEGAALPLASFKKLFDAAVLHLKPFWGIQFHAYGAPSAVNRIASNATAFAFRDTLWSVQMASNFKPSQEESHVAGFKAFRTVANDVFDTGAYRCYPDALLSTHEYMDAYYRGNADRLRTLKLQYDPTSLFKFEQSIE
jgi:FAD/FMN-containing dehydrogenase